MKTSDNAVARVTTENHDRQKFGKFITLGVNVWGLLVRSARFSFSCDSKGGLRVGSGPT
jgi:hypothetical protein